MNANPDIRTGSNQQQATRQIAIVTSCADDWGGSEELWARTIPYLQEEGYQIKVYKAGLNTDHPAFRKLAAAGVRLKELYPPQLPDPVLSRRIFNKFWRRIRPSEFIRPESNTEVFRDELLAEKPELVIVSQGINFDGIPYGLVCADLNIPYVLVAQKAVDFYWPASQDRPVMTKVLKKAEKCFFVSRHNLQLTEEQFGFRFQNARVIFNPVKLSGEIIPYPSTGSGYKLACIGRYFLLDKGQDILIRIMASDKWRNRPVQVSFIGAGTDKTSLEDFARLLNVQNIRFMDYQPDIAQVWKEYHALVLPSRSEGMPLVMLEAMSAGRTVIVSNAGGNAEIIEEGVTGFIGEPFEKSFDDALERAWQKREHWATMGKSASESLKKLVPANPELEFASHLKSILHG